LYTYTEELVYVRGELDIARLDIFFVLTCKDEFTVPGSTVSTVDHLQTCIIEVEEWHIAATTESATADYVICFICYSKPQFEFDYTNMSESLFQALNFVSGYGILLRKTFVVG